MIAKLGQVLNRWSQRWVPDPFVLALFLTFIVLGIGLIRMSSMVTVTGALNLNKAATMAADSPALFWPIFDSWFQGMTQPTLLAFALKMCLILVTGHALALSPPVRRGIEALARVPQNAAQATVIVATFSCAAAVFHWGVGAIAGALLAREMARANQGGRFKLHYPLLGAAAYAGMAVWHGGLTGSAPTKVAGANHAFVDSIGVVPMSETVFSTGNLIITSALILFIAVLFWALCPKDESDFIPAGNALDIPKEEEPPANESVVHWLQESVLLGRCIGLLGTSMLLYALGTDHMKMDLNWITILFVFLAMAAQGSLRRYGQAIADGAHGAGAIILQFPFYFGILGIMKATDLITAFSNSLVSMATETTLPIVAFLSAGLVNLFVPSGGGQWAVQGEILMNAAAQVGADPGLIIMSFSYGDAWTNMLQPFWALPLLGIMGLRAKDIIGYTAVLCLALAIVVPVLLLTFAPLF